VLDYPREKIKGKLLRRGTRLLPGHDSIQIDTARAHASLVATSSMSHKSS
jgi:hypothetical protein